MRAIAGTFIALVAFPIAGCATADVERYAQDPYRFNGVTHGAGEAVAANSAMQIINPMPRTASRTTLLVPAERATRDSNSGSSTSTSE